MAGGATVLFLAILFLVKVFVLVVAAAAVTLGVTAEHFLELVHVCGVLDR